ncbi:ESX secretion-associated protein EspG [Nocardia neocaledoniensis]|uniref:ESX secretion-associated protein EspG n=1 Tax=Nocardia neocaledoniensis TaxID=236511 RepID=UPI001FC8FF72|nr:ESX secretion-associated protein EspG [Nocardia neocaledoniensis]
MAVDLTVDAALVLKDLAGIDSYPTVLALMPNIYRIDDRARVRAAVRPALAEAGIADGDRVHPVIVRWLECLHRPDIEMVVRVLDTGLGATPAGMLRMSLVRSETHHVLAARCDDAVVIQSVFQPEPGIDGIVEALNASLGPAPVLRFDPVRMPLAELATVPSDPASRREALLSAGAVPHTAGVLSRVLDEVVRRAEILIVEHHDGGSVETEVCLSVLDTLSGRMVVTPRAAMDGEIWSTYSPGDPAALRAGISALIELLPGRSWFATSRAE